MFRWVKLYWNNVEPCWDEKKPETANIAFNHYLVPLFANYLRVAMENYPIPVEVELNGDILER